MTTCVHPEFRASVDVTRILNDVPEDEGGEAVHFAADVRVECAACGEPFGFRGVPCGVSIVGVPMRSADALELRAWLLSPAELALVEQPAGVMAP